MCGLLTTLKWFLLVLVKFPIIIRSKNLQSADMAMGKGPFAVTLKKTFFVGIPNNGGGSPFTGIREMYVRNTYLKDKLKFSPNSLVVDLGANIGNFSNLALSADDSIRVIAVEPSLIQNTYFDYSLNLNMWRERATLVRAFIGKVTDKSLFNFEGYQGAEIMSDTEFVQRYNIDSIDFLKCDIEGGEFAFLEKDSRILHITKKIAIEIHASDDDDPKEFISHLSRLGFIIKSVAWEKDGSCTLLASK